MFNHIMVPYTLAERRKWARAVKVAADLARRYQARITLVTVGGGLHGPKVQFSQDDARLLEAFAAGIAETEGVDVATRTYNVGDPSVDLDRTLIEAIDDIGADLVVMASHKPSWIDYLVRSHGGKMAARAKVSVFVVRDDD